MNRKNFTLIELLAVMAIIAILAGLIIGGAGLASRKAAEAKTTARMKKIELALDQYKIGTGYYPMYDTSDHEADYRSMLADLAGVDKARQALDDWNGDQTNYKDGFHEQFLYQCPGTHNTTQYDLWSKGSDGNNDNGTGDDITNWTRQ